MPYKNKKGKKSLIILAVLIAVATIFILLILWASNKNATNDDSSINYDPPTQVDKNEVDQNKNRIAEEENNSNNNGSSGGSASSNKKSVLPVITYAGQESAGSNLEINGYVPDIVEQSGKCTLTLTKGNNKVTKTRDSFSDAQSTSCGLIEVPRSSLSAGKWQAILSYSSNRSAGNSSRVDVEVK